MVERRDRAGEAAHQRLRASMEEAVGVLSDRLDDRFDRLDVRLSRMESDIGFGKLDRQHLASEIQEVRRDVGELRDAANVGAKAVEPVVVTATETAVKKAAKGWPAKVIALAVGFTAIMVALNNIPDAVRAVERTWAFMGNRDVKAIATPAGKAKP